MSEPVPRVDDAKRNRYDREFRDVKVASISALEWDEVHQEARCSDTSYVLGSEHADDFFPRIWVEMNRRSHDLTQLRLVFIGDGAEWIWRRVAEVENAASVHILISATPSITSRICASSSTGRVPSSSLRSCSCGASDCARAGQR